MEEKNPSLLHAKLGAYMADYIEPNRDKAPDLKEIRRLSFENIEEALFRVLEGTLNYLADKPDAIDPMTKISYDFYDKFMDILYKFRFNTYLCYQ